MIVIEHNRNIKASPICGSPARLHSADGRPSFTVVDHSRGLPASLAVMKPVLDHLDRVVRPGLRRYAEAEAALTKAHVAQDPIAIDAARVEAGLAARQAVDGLHHLADFMWKEPGCWPRMFADLEDVRSEVESRCLFLRNAQVPIKADQPAGQSRCRRTSFPSQADTAADGGERGSGAAWRRRW